MKKIKIVNIINTIELIFLILSLFIVIKFKPKFDCSSLGTSLYGDIISSYCKLGVSGLLIFLSLFIIGIIIIMYLVNKINNENDRRRK